MTTADDNDDVPSVKPLIDLSEVDGNVYDMSQIWDALQKIGEIRDLCDTVLDGTAMTFTGEDGMAAAVLNIIDQEARP